MVSKSFVLSWVLTLLVMKKCLKCLLLAILGTRDPLGRWNNFFFKCTSICALQHPIIKSLYINCKNSEKQQRKWYFMPNFGIFDNFWLLRHLYRKKIDVSSFNIWISQNGTKNFVFCRVFTLLVKKKCLNSFYWLI